MLKAFIPTYKKSLFPNFYLQYKQEILSVRPQAGVTYTPPFGSLRVGLSVCEGSNTGLKSRLPL